MTNGARNRLAFYRIVDENRSELFHEITHTENRTNGLPAFK